MDEFKKTFTFVVVAVAVALIAWITRPSLSVFQVDDMRGRPLFPDFTDPLAASSLEIFEFDETTATVRPFKVAQVEDRWSIPSHDNYPADAKDHLADAAAAMMGLKVLDRPSDSPGDHELYGVVDPDPKTLKAGASGVGKQMTMRDKNGKVLLSLIIGKKVPDREGLHYVRRPGEDPVYTVEVKTDKLSTKFEDWIEEDLLKLNYWDIKQVQIHDYSIDELAGTLNFRDRMVLDYDDTGEVKWKMAQDMLFQKGKWVPQQMAEDEELNTDKLDDMKRALDDLEIIDVSRKPEGLSADLKAGEQFVNNPQAVASLQSRGFYRATLEDRVELFSNEGEIRCLMKDGAHYILRFGNIAGTAGGSAEDEEEQQEPKEEGAEAEHAEQQKKSEDADHDGGVSRYLFVMAEFDPSPIEKPELKPLPEKPAEGENKKDEKGKDEAAKEVAAENEATEQKQSKNDPAEQQATKEAPDELEKPKSDAAEGDQAKEEKHEPIKEWEKEVEQIKKDNKRKQEEYDEKIKKGKEKVKELNARFADWYYIISDETYRKIHLSRQDIVKKKEKKEDEKENKKDEQTDDGADKKAKQEAAGDADKKAAGGADQKAENEKPKKEADSPADPESPKQHAPVQDE